MRQCHGSSKVIHRWTRGPRDGAAFVQRRCDGTCCLTDDTRLHRACRWEQARGWPTGRGGQPRRQQSRSVWKAVGTVKCEVRRQSLEIMKAWRLHLVGPLENCSILLVHFPSQGPRRCNSHFKLQIALNILNVARSACLCLSMQLVLLHLP